MSKRTIFYDTETTGTKPGKDRIIEIAAFEPAFEKSFCTLTHPECPIPPDATSISGINDEMVANAPKIAEALTAFLEFCSGDVVLIAHNNDAFDKLFLEAEFQRANLTMPKWAFIDSLKWSRKYRTDLPRHGLQHLREVYGIEANQAHRALDDCMILHQVFSRMVGDLSIDQIQDLLQKKTQITRMPFGKHAGKTLTDIPKDYLIWLSGSGALDKPDNALLKETLEKLGRLP